MMAGPEEVLAFWLDEVGDTGWYKDDAELDAEIRVRFERTWRAAQEGPLSLWLTYPSGVLAYVILTDQFPRNMFRGSAKAFSTDRVAKAAAKAAVHKNWDLKIDEPARQFFYMPFMHSENLCDQEQCIRLVLDRMPETGANTLLHARAHREVIRQFGRFPYRNGMLSRTTTAPEADYVSSGGYGSTVRALQATSEPVSSE